MIDALHVLHPYFKVIHIVAFICWMAGLLYLPRLFVYHAAAAADIEPGRTFIVMERRLLNFIMNPAMAVVWISGLLLAPIGFEFRFWTIAKLICVLLLTWFHFQLSLWRKAFAQTNHPPPHSPLFFRFINEIPTVLMIVIVGLVVLKPF